MPIQSSPRRLLFAVVIFIFPQTLLAQFVNSAFKEASMAYVALSGLGMDFASANPALLSTLPYDRRFAMTLETNHDDIENFFKDDLPDFSLQFAITSRFTIAFAQSERALPTQASALRSNADDPVRLHPLRFLSFGYQHDWSAGLGVRLKADLSTGIAMRHENYTVVPAYLGPFPFAQSFRVIDLGLRRFSSKLNLGLVLRNLYSNRTTEPFTQPIRFTNLSDPSQSFDWHPHQFNSVALEPRFNLEGGAHWLVSSHWQLLGDLTSRKEYALGLRWRVLSRFFITTGAGKRFDRIYRDTAVRYTVLGGQFQKEQFALGLGWIIPAKGKNQIVSMPYGTYNLNQITNNRLLIAGALSL